MVSKVEEISDSQINSSQNNKNADAVNFEISLDDTDFASK